MCALLLFLPLSGNAQQQVFNYRAVNGVNDILISGSTVWLATTGGLCKYNTIDKSTAHFTASDEFPDLELTALAFDSKNNLWIGTREGYLYRRSPDGSQIVVNSYFAYGWDIVRLLTVGDKLVVASSKGCSVFDPVRTTAVKNASTFTPFASSAVNALTVNGDTLYLGCPEGIAKLGIAGNALDTLNFFDPSIWTTQSVGFNVASFTIEQGKVVPHTGPSARFRGSLISAGADSIVYRDSTTPLFNKLQSPITTIVADGDAACWIGTEETFFYRWDGTTCDSIPIAGPSFILVKKIFADHTGRVWVLPTLPRPGFSQWFVGVSSFDGTSWKLYNKSVAPTMASLFGDNPEWHAVSEDVTGNIWVGTPGGNVKMWSRHSDSWSGYCISVTSTSFNDPVISPAFFAAEPCPTWGMTSTIGSDSSGYVWIANWQNNYGCLICYDPRFPPIRRSRRPRFSITAGFFRNPIPISWSTPRHSPPRGAIPSAWATTSAASWCSRTTVALFPTASR